MSRADAFPGVRPLGISYALGQGVMHGPIPADPNDPHVPAPEYIVAFGEAVDGALYDKEGWGPAEYAAAASALRGRQDVRDVYAAFLRNGPIPTDTEVEGTTDMFEGDNASAIRHVYFYDDMDNYGGGAARGRTSTLSGNAALYVQIQGYSENAGAWALPYLWGEHVPAWRQDFGSAAHQWKAVFSSGQWVDEHAESLRSAFMWAWAAVFAVVTAGTGAALVAAAAPALAAATGIAVGTVTSVINGLWVIAVGAAKYCVLGDSRGLTAALMSGGGQIVGAMKPGDIDALAKKFPGSATVITDVVQPFTALAADIQNSPALSKLMASGGELEALMSSAQRLAPGLRRITPDVWQTATDALGGKTSVGGAFMSAIRGAGSLDQIRAAFAATPWYAQGFVQYASAFRVVEIAQLGVQSVAVVHDLSQGLLTMRERARQEAMVAKLTSALGLMTINPKAPPTGSHSLSLLGPNGEPLSSGASGGALLAVAALAAAVALSRR